jgi:hypothetical protein
MPRKIAIRLLAVVLMVAVCVLGAQAVGHSHEKAFDEQHCQVCHIGHVAIPQPTVQAEVQTPAPVARSSPAEESSRSLESARTLSIPRAPPA